MMTLNVVNLIALKTNQYGHLAVYYGVYRSKTESICGLWSMMNGSSIFRAVMSKNADSTTRRLKTNH